MRISDWSSDVCSSDLHRLIDHIVDIAVEVACFENIGNLGDGALVEHERSQNRLLRLFGMGRHTERIDGGFVTRHNIERMTLRISVYREKKLAVSLDGRQSF